MLCIGSARGACGFEAGNGVKGGLKGAIEWCRHHCCLMFRYIMNYWSLRKLVARREGNKDD